MTPAITEPRRPRDWRPNISQRGIAIGLTILAELIFLMILLGLQPSSWTQRKPSRPTTVDLIPEDKPEPPPPIASAGQTAQVPADDPIPRPPPPRVPPVPNAKSPFLEMSREDFAAADISKLGTAGGKVAAAGQGASDASIGTGPGGVALYAADWYPRRPTDAELNGYLPKRSIAPGSWAEVVCRTIPGNRVENCQAIGESPPGSGLASAIRQAGWQFRIRPPRVNGKPQVGTWVKVHIQFTKRPTDP
jgi:protein TonB